MMKRGFLKARLFASDAVRSCVFHIALLVSRTLVVCIVVVRGAKRYDWWQPINLLVCGELLRFGELDAKTALELGKQAAFPSPTPDM